MAFSRNLSARRDQDAKVSFPPRPSGKDMVLAILHRFSWPERHFPLTYNLTPRPAAVEVVLSLFTLVTGATGVPGASAPRWAWII